jgi:hypothetical protein
MAQITTELLEKINRLRMRGDARLIAESNNVSRVLIYKAFQTGTCSQRVLDIIVEFYTTKEKVVDAILDDLNHEA